MFAEPVLGWGRSRAGATRRVGWCIVVSPWSSSHVSRDEHGSPSSSDVRVIRTCLPGAYYIISSVFAVVGHVRGKGGGRGERRDTGDGVWQLERTRRRPADCHVSVAYVQFMRRAHARGSRLIGRPSVHFFFRDDSRRQSFLKLFQNETAFGPVRRTYRNYFQYGLALGVCKENVWVRSKMQKKRVVVYGSFF